MFGTAGLLLLLLLLRLRTREVVPLAIRPHDKREVGQKCSAKDTGKATHDHMRILPGCGVVRHGCTRSSVLTLR